MRVRWMVVNEADTSGQVVQGEGSKQKARGKKEERARTKPRTIVRSREIGSKEDRERVKIGGRD